MEDLIDACNEAIYNFTGSENGVKRRQVYDDITFMESEEGYGIELERIRDGRKVYMRYLDPNYSIKGEGLNEDEAQNIQEAILTLSRFKGLPQFEWVHEMEMRLESVFDIKREDKQIIEFDQNPYLKGLEYVSEFYKAISEQQVLEITYQGFKQECPTVFEFHPYFLKQYNSRWFVIGRNPAFENLTHLALDRVVEINRSESEFQISNIDFEDYFEDVVGVTIPEGKDLEKIILEVNNSALPYIESKPIHGSQKVRERKNETTIVELELIPNYELKSVLLSYLGDIKVIEPLSLKEELKKKLEKGIDNI